MSPLGVLCICLLLGVGSSAFIGQDQLPDHRIVGGEEVDISSHPHQLSFQSNGYHFCGASIISRKWAITAAHCVGSSVSSYSVGAGSSNNFNSVNNHKVVRAIPHPNYGGLDYDVALLEIEDEFAFGENVQAIKLADRELKQGELVNVTGWGALSEGGSSPDSLMKVSVPIVNRRTCANAYYPSVISERMICAGLMGQGGKDSCQGDSGGPLTKDGVLYGIVSWGRGCARPEFPGVYSNVANLRPWITRITGI